MSISFQEGHPISAGHPTHTRSNNNKTKGNPLPLYKIGRLFHLTLNLAPHDQVTLTLGILIDEGGEACFEQVKNCKFNAIEVDESHKKYVKPIYNQGQLLIKSVADSALRQVKMKFVLPEVSKKKPIGSMTSIELPIYCFLLETGNGNLYRPYVFGIINGGSPEPMQRKYAKLIRSKYPWVLDPEQVAHNSPIKHGGDPYANSLDHNQALSNSQTENRPELFDCQAFMNSSQSPSAINSQSSDMLPGNITHYEETSFFFIERMQVTETQSE